MSVATMLCAAEVTTRTYRDLVETYRAMPEEARALVGTWIVKTPITANQKKRLPADVRRKLVVGEKARNDVQFLERLYRLDDPRK